MDADARTHKKGHATLLQMTNILEKILLAFGEGPNWSMIFTRVIVPREGQQRAGLFLKDLLQWWLVGTKSKTREDTTRWRRKTHEEASRWWFRFPMQKINHLTIPVRSKSRHVYSILFPCRYSKKRKHMYGPKYPKRLWTTVTWIASNRKLAGSQRFNCDTLLHKQPE